MKLLSLVKDPTTAGGRSVQLMTDSAVIKDGRPFFVPAIATEWDYSMGVAFRIGRMGKTISEKFALRYIDAVTLCIMPRPRNVTADMAIGGEMLHAFDGAAIIGTWMDIPDDNTLDVTFNGTPVEITPHPMEEIVPMVALMSLFGTLKTGDIMIPSSTPVGVNFPENHTCQATINNIECLKFRIK